MRRREVVAGLAAVTVVVLLRPVPARGQAPVGSEFRVNSYTTSLQNQASVASDASGRFVVVWRSQGQDGSSNGVFGRRYDAMGVPQGAEFQVNSYTTSGQDHPSVASDPTGRFVAVWQSNGQDGSSYGVFGRRYDAAGTPLGAEFRVNAYTTSSQNHASVASDATGRFVVVWESYGQDGSQSGIFGRRYDATGTPLGVEFQVNSLTLSLQQTPSVAWDATGTVLVVWGSYQYSDGNAWGVSGQRFNAAGLPQGGEFQVNSYTTSNQIVPRLASDGSGNSVVVWSSMGQDGSGFGVFGQRYDAAGVPQGGEFQVNSYTTSDQTYPAVASEAAGNFVVIWQSAGQDGSYQGIFGQAFDATGTRRGIEFPVNSYTTFVQVAPSVASDATGNFVVAWQSYSDGYADSVAGRRFKPDLIFADGFESGDLSAWSSSETGSGDLSASASSALAGTATGVRAVVNDTGALYVRDDTPSGEGRYRARFYFDPDGFDPGEAQGHRRTRIFIAFDESPVKRHVAVVLRRVSGQYGVEARARVDDNSQIDTGFFDVTDAPHFIELDWRQATDAVSNDGSLEMWIDGVSVSTLTSLSNSLRSVDFVRLGPQSLKGGAAGTLYFDEFESRRLQMIGP
jgi:hypothetical protein